MPHPEGDMPPLQKDRHREQELILMRTIIGLNSPFSFGIPSPRLLAPLALLAASLYWMQMLPAQAPATSTPPAAAHKTTHRHKRASATPAQQSTSSAAILPITPVPELPLWPANEKPTAASVIWDSQGLYISATNSSLRQILTEVATVTGATVEGLVADERIFGNYGPGKAHEVLSQLLLGTSYNVLMIGDQGEGTPREIVLSTRHAADGTTMAGNPPPKAEDDQDSDEQPQQPPQQPPARPPFGPGGQRSPQPMRPQSAPPQQ
ncbi:MAG: hypothetical protein ABR905_09575 [Terracidiphilus sp.]|jgi:hypothetical protein